LALEYRNYDVVSKVLHFNSLLFGIVINPILTVKNGYRLQFSIY